jgi:hypothetical protein
MSEFQVNQRAFRASHRFTQFEGQIRLRFGDVSFIVKLQDGKREGALLEGFVRIAPR